MHVCIAGTRGIPARHGGFETFAQDLALYLAGRGHQVTVYCQEPSGVPPYDTSWEKVELRHLPGGDGPVGTILFDLRCALEASRGNATILTLGYNTAIFSVFHRLRGRVHLMNMDGIEWKREKWSRVQRLWLRVNEYAGAKLANHLIADHPVIRAHHLKHASSKKISVIPYGAQPVVTPNCDALRNWLLAPRGYAVVIARPEPDNSILEVVRAFSKRQRGIKLVVLGSYDRSVSYQRQVLDAASKEVVFVGAIYDKPVVQVLRGNALLYLHGHKVGGTNPSLVESLAAGNAVIAHDNLFTRWVAGPGARFFSNVETLDATLTELLSHPPLIYAMEQATRERFNQEFHLNTILESYESLLLEITRHRAGYFSWMRLRQTG